MPSEVIAFNHRMIMRQRGLKPKNKSAYLAPIGTKLVQKIHQELFDGVWVDVKVSPPMPVVLNDDRRPRCEFRVSQSVEL